MSNKVKPSNADWLKLVGLLVVICVVVIDIVLVRGKNKLLLNNLLLQKTESAKTIQMIEMKSDEEVARANQRIKDAERRVVEATRKVKDAESELRDKTEEIQRANEKKLDELKASYEKRIQEMKDDFNNRMSDAIETVRKKTPPQAIPATLQTQSTVRCRRCAGQGSITEKVRCPHCGGSGKIKETTTHWKRYGSGQRVSTTFTDCPYCLPGAMKGSGSKGYTIERKQCPNCNGAGMINLK